MIDRKRALKPLFHQVWIELCNLLSKHHALVDQRAARERADVEAIDASSSDSFFDPTADHIQFTLKQFVKLSKLLHKLEALELQNVP